MAKSPRRFDDEQVALILERAAELQQLEGGMGDSGTGLSLVEIEDVADGAGLNKALVRRAAAEIGRAQPPSTPAGGWLGGPSDIALTAVVEGELPVEAHEYLVEAIHARIGEFGETSRVGNTFTWLAKGGGQAGGMRTVQVRIVVREGHTRIQIDEKLGMLKGALYGGLLGGLGGGGTGIAILPFILLGAPALIPVGLAAWFGGVFALTRGIYKRRVGTRQAELEALLSDLVTVTRERMERPGLRAGDVD